MTTDYLDTLSSVDVCVDCYFAYHCGAHSHTRVATDQELDHWRHAEGNSYHARQIMGLTFFLDGETLMMVTEWFAGESDSRCEGGEPLRLLDGLELSDWTYDESDPDSAEQIERYGDGHTEFTWKHCEGCGCSLGGSRERLAIHSPRGTT